VTVQLGSATLVTLLLASIRISAWLMIAPPFATAGIPRTIRYGLATGLALAVTSTASAHAPPAEVGPMFTSAIEQLVIGGALGFITGSRSPSPTTRWQPPTRASSESSTAC
jgi:flagellar biosynthetic protein FliR